MAEKRHGRWVHTFYSPEADDWCSSGVELTLTRRGVYISGWYDSMVGIESRRVSWSEFDAAREAVMKGRAALAAKKGDES